MLKDEFIRGLNEDLSAELGTIIRYNYQSSKAFGVTGMEIRDMFEGEIQDELGHASFLMDTIVDLGGEPTTKPKEFDKSNDDMQSMLELDLKMELQDVENYKERAKQAEELGAIDLKLKLEDMAADEAGHARKLTRILKGLK